MGDCFGTSVADGMGSDIVAAKWSVSNLVFLLVAVKPSAARPIQVGSKGNL